MRPKRQCFLPTLFTPKEGPYICLHTRRFTLSVVAATHPRSLRGVFDVDRGKVQKRPDLAQFHDRGKRKRFLCHIPEDKGLETSTTAFP